MGEIGLSVDVSGVHYCLLYGRYMLVAASGRSILPIYDLAVNSSNTRIAGEYLRIVIARFAYSL